MNWASPSCKAPWTPTATAWTTGRTWSWAPGPISAPTPTIKANTTPAGYSLKDLVDADIAAHPEYYPNIETPDGNIDFRRVSNLDTFFRRHAQVLTCELDDPAQWQPGDIVIFGDRDHIGICSDRRNRQGIPFLIHHGNPIDEAVERNDMGKYVITGHFRWMG